MRHPWYTKQTIDPIVLALDHCDPSDPEEVEYHRLREECNRKKLIHIRKGGDGKMHTFTELRTLLGIDKKE